MTRQDYPFGIFKPFFPHSDRPYPIGYNGFVYIYIIQRPCIFLPIDVVLFLHSRKGQEN